MRYPILRSVLPALSFVIGLSLLCLSGCRPEAPAASPGGGTADTTASSEKASSTPPTAAVTKPADPTTAPTLFWPAYEEPSLMPPLEGSTVPDGRMLWPVQRGTEPNMFGTTNTRYAFINEKGAQVLPASYILYHYETDPQGRYQYLCASTGRRVDFFTLDGKKVLEIAAETANCIKGTDLVFANLYISSTGGPLKTDARATLYDMKTGKRLLQQDYICLSLLNPELVWARDPDCREYLIDLRKGESRRIPLAGYTDQYLSGGSYAPVSDIAAADVRLPASDLPYDPFEMYDRDPHPERRVGFLGADGKWAVEPVYLEAMAFRGEYAAVRLAEDEWRFIDRQGRFADGEVYQTIRGYDFQEDIVYAAADAAGKAVYLNAELEQVPLRKQGWVKGQFYYDDRPVDGLPKKYTKIYSVQWPMLLAGGIDGSAYLLNMETGKGYAIDGQYGAITRVGDLYFGQAGDDVVVLDAQGRLLTDTVFSRYPSAAGFFSPYHKSEAADAGYFWVTSAQYQGYADITGKWLYRESRFGLLED